MASEKVPMLLASSRRAYNAPVERVADAILDSKGHAKFEPSVERIEIVEPGRRERVYFHGLDKPLEFLINRTTDADGTVTISMNSELPAGLTFFSYTVRSTRTATVVDAQMSVFFKLRGIDPNAYTPHMQKGLDQILERVGALAGEGSTRAQAGPSRQFTMKIGRVSIAKPKSIAHRKPVYSVVARICASARA